MEQVECIVIGAGVVGLAVARALAMAGTEVLILDKEPSFGMETSARNSEVIHAGIYYPKGSLKAELCVAGRDMLYEYCQARRIDHKKCGKLIVACSKNDVTKLKEIKQKAEDNGVHDLALLSQDQVLEKEPALNAVAGLFSPSTGIIDSHSFMLSLLGDIENNGGMFVPKTKILGGRVVGGGFVLNLKDTKSAEIYEIKANMVVNSAGLHVTDFLKDLQGFPDNHIPRTYYAKGSYFSLSTKTDFKHLVYPVPEVGGLGIHLTLDMEGRAKFGPNVEWIDEINYNMDAELADVFFESIKKYWPGVKKEALSPDYCGIRPKIAPKGQVGDFVIQTQGDHGIKNMVNLFGIESPGLTASLAIAKHVEKCIL